MTYAFDTKSAAFSPEEIAALRAAFDLASRALRAEGELTAATTAKLGKVLVNLARDALKTDHPLVAADLAERAGRYIGELRRQGLLD